MQTLNWAMILFRLWFQVRFEFPTPLRCTQGLLATFCVLSLPLASYSSGSYFPFVQIPSLTSCTRFTIAFLSMTPRHWGDATEILYTHGYHLRRATRSQSSPWIKGKEGLAKRQAPSRARGAVCAPGGPARGQRTAVARF